MTYSGFFLADYLLNWLGITSYLLLWGGGFIFAYCLIQLVEPLGALAAFDISDKEI